MIRARDLGIPFDGTPGRWNAITDVPGVEVGHTTLITGDAVRTGVTAIHPRGRLRGEPCFGGWATLNGNGEMTGTTWLEEGGFLEGPIAITNTHSVGVVRDAILAWQHATGRPGTQPWGLPVVAETYDGYLNDIDGQHVRAEHAIAALDGARDGAVEEGCVGGGTGMICHEFKGGIGSSSRVVGPHTVGVLVQANYGRRRELRIAGVPVGEALPEDAVFSSRDGSIIVVVATDAPLLPHQLRRVARRPALGIARCGGVGADSSGDIFVAFSVANPEAAKQDGTPLVAMLPNARLTELFEATVQATEEAIVNALVAARSMSGRDGHRVVALPHDRLREVLQKHGRLVNASDA